VLAVVQRVLPEVARPLYERCATLLRDVEGIPTGCGIFAAAMRVSLTNDGPVTLIIPSRG